LQADQSDCNTIIFSVDENIEQTAARASQPARLQSAREPASIADRSQAESLHFWLQL